MYKPHNKKVYLAVGDSITWTNGFASQYPSQVARFMSKDIGQVQLINKGIGGTTSGRLLKFLNDYVNRISVDLMTIGVGMNDAANGAVSLTKFEQNLGEMVEQVRRNNPKCEIILFGIVTAIEPSRLSNGVGGLSAYRTSIQNVATAKGCLYYNPFSLWTTSYDDSYLYVKQFSSGNRYVNKGSWNATTNSTTELDGGANKTFASATNPGTLGDYYRVTVAGNTTLDGVGSWTVDDAVIWNGTAWKKRTGVNWSAVSPVQNYRGTWNATSNATTPLSGGSVAIVSGTGVLGDWYRIDTAGTTTIDTIATWAVGECIFFNGTIWIKETLDWIHPIASGHELISAGLYAFLQANSRFYLTA